MFELADVAFFCREHDAGEELDVVWARDGEVHRDRVRLDARDERVFEHTA